MKIRFRLILLALFSALMFFSGCRKELVREPLPTDGKPSIRRTAPVQASSVARRGSQVNIRFSLADNEELLRWSIRETIVSNIRTVDTNIAVGGRFIDTTILKADTVRKSEEIYFEALRGNIVEKTFNYTVPGLDPFQRILLTATVFDNKRQSASENFVITVDVQERDTLARYFTLIDYTSTEPDVIFNGTAGNLQSAFNLIARDYVRTNNPAAKDIEEATTAPGTFLKQFRSPASEPDSALVVVSPNDFNFDECTYATIWQAFNTRRPRRITPELKAGDIVIVKLMLRHSQLVKFSHYAVLQIQDISIVGGGMDYITFRYKRSQDF